MTARRAAVALVALLASVLLPVLPGWSPPAAAARTVDVVLTDREPAAVSLAPGDGVRFVSGETGMLAPPHRVTATQQDGSTSWEYDSGQLDAGESTDLVVFERPGTYLFVDRRGLLVPTERVGRIVVAAPAAPAASPAPPAPAPTTAAPAPPAPAATADPTPPAASSGGGTGGAPPPPLTGGATAAPLGELGGAVVPPSIADALGTPGPTAAPRPAGVQALDGPLPGAGTSRGLGLPATLAALAVVGVVSLLARVLLAEPAARRLLTPVAA